MVHRVPAGEYPCGVVVTIVIRETASRSSQKVVQQLVMMLAGRRVVKFSPGQILLLGFAGMILIGALLLTLPFASESGESLNFLDALFTATSAVCVTGLVVVDTATRFTTFGEVVIMLLIQAGGLGFMTVSTLIALALRRRVSLQDRLVIREGLNQESLAGVVRLVRMVTLTTATIELTGLLLLSLRFVPQFGLGRGLYYSLFHSVSAFNNAGFDLMGGFRNLTGYVTDPLVSLTISALIVLGGIGFTVISEVRRRRDFHKLSLHSKLVLTFTAVLIAGGALGFWLLERQNPATLGRLPLGGQLLASLFQSITPRTAGFNTVDLSALYPSTWMLLIMLMFIGASPGSTGGGVKTSTIGVLLATVWAAIRGEPDTVLFRRRIPADTIRRSLAIVTLALLLLLVTTMILSRTEQFLTIRLLFEATSAFATVGLTTGITPELSATGRILMILLMYTGRVGPLTLAAAIATRLKQQRLREAEERVMVG